MSMWTAIVICAVCATICKGMACRVRRSDDDATEDSRSVQDFHRMLRRMEERLESLETLVLDSSTKYSGFSERYR